jgi:hypothetical protein
VVSKLALPNALVFLRPLIYAFENQLPRDCRRTLEPECPDIVYETLFRFSHCILNGLGFVSAPMYLFSRFSEGKPTEHLLGEGVRSG